MDDGQKIRAIQILRFIAAGLVVWLHAVILATDLTNPGTMPNRFDSLGAAGVDIFFVISGAIICQTMKAYHGKPGTFFLRRFLRVAPIYYIVTIVCLPFLGTVDWHFSNKNILVSMTFWPVWDGIQVPVLRTGWTLCFEMLFYLGAAICLASKRAIWFVLSGFVFFWLAKRTGWAPATFLGSPIIFEFLAGATVMNWWPKRQYPVWFGIILAGMAIAFFTVIAPPARLAYGLHPLNGELSGLRVLIWGIPATMLLISGLSLERFLGGRWTDIPVLMGDASYSIYLVHWPLLASLAWVSAFYKIEMPYNIFTLIFLVAGVGAGLLVYWLIERPLLRLLKYPGKRLPCAAEGVPS